MTTPIVEQPRLPEGAALVYLRAGHVAHLAASGNDRDTQCRAVDRAALQNMRHSSGDSYLLGTGSQDEWEKARSLPLCRTCFPKGPRRPAVTR